MLVAAYTSTSVRVEEAGPSDINDYIVVAAPVGEQLYSNSDARTPSASSSASAGAGILLGAHSALGTEQALGGATNVRNSTGSGFYAAFADPRTFSTGTARGVGGDPDGLRRDESDEYSTPMTPGQHPADADAAYVQLDEFDDSCTSTSPPPPPLGVGVPGRRRTDWGPSAGSPPAQAALPARRGTAHGDGHCAPAPRPPRRSTSTATAGSQRDSHGYEVPSTLLGLPQSQGGQSSPVYDNTFTSKQTSNMDLQAVFAGMDMDRETATPMPPPPPLLPRAAPGPGALLGSQYCQHKYATSSPAPPWRRAWHHL